jgi:glutamate-1-semialdehyde 2,1-aminomutase
MITAETRTLRRPSEETALAWALDEARAAFADRNPESRAQFARAAAVMPGGNTRTVLFYDPFPLTIVRGEGCRLFDADGHVYVDLLGEFTAGIYGHSHPVIRRAIETALAGGINLSGHNKLEAELAAIICGRIPSVDRLRFTNSGTEANMMAIALAKAATGRGKILVFDGGYHGSTISFAGGASPINLPHDFIVADYNDVEGARRLIRTHGRDLAAVLVEPMLGAGGCIPGTLEFIACLREESLRVDALLIFDEVMTSRLSGGGRQAQIGISPDLTVLGKYLGGGMSFGAFGGRADLMDLFDPRRGRVLPHPGTFNNNVMTMAAGIAGLTRIYTPEIADQLSARGDAIA